MSPEPRAGTSVASHRATGVASRALAAALLALLGLLLVEVLLEGWIQVRFGVRTTDPAGTVVVDPLQWPKTLKNGLYLLLAGLTALAFTLDRRWRELRTGADIAIVGLGLALLLAGLLGGSSARLIGEALFVYLRGAIAFYAWRAARPDARQIRLVLTVVGGLVAINVVLALAQMIVGRPLYTWLGWVDLQWANTNRAHGLLNHPNHLGHVLGLALLGLLAWIVTRERVRYPVWLLFGVVALALSATQSRESVVAFVVSGGALWLLVRARGWRVVAAVLAVGLMAGAQVAARPSNWAEWERRFAGVFDAFRVPSGAEPTVAPSVVAPTASGEPAAPPPARPYVPPREIRVLYYQQGLALWAQRPITGYGVGQFGGIVAQENDPEWYLNPKFGPDGFDWHGFRGKQVDSFWLHLTVEAGTLGLLAYLAWLFLLARPLLRARDPSAEGAPLRLWAVAALLFAVLVAFLSPSLEDPILPPLLFTIVGLAWVTRGPQTVGAPAPTEAPSESSAALR